MSTHVLGRQERSQPLSSLETQSEENAQVTYIMQVVTENEPMELQTNTRDMYEATLPIHCPLSAAPQAVAPCSYRSCTMRV